MRPGEPSRTAQWVAVLRGIAHHERPAIADDPLAVELLTGGSRALVRLAGAVPPLTRAFLAALDALSGGRSRFMSVRTRVLDDVVREARAAGFEQVVLLGAGLDARAWRLGELAGATVWEVDHPDTQGFKRARLGERAPLAGAVHFVGVDFEKDALDARLAASGLRADVPTLLLWEGVVMYLPPEVIDATLRTLHPLLAPGSRLAISYSRTGHGSTAWTRRALGVVVGAAGETFRHHEEPAEMAARLDRSGYRVRWDRGHPDWAPALLGRPTRWDIQRIVVAERT